MYQIFCKGKPLARNSVQPFLGGKRKILLRRAMAAITTATCRVKLLFKVAEKRL